jgi:DHA1 family bicyclomycin/chloramphenicol resistance-like MFS transporter
LNGCSKVTAAQSTDQRPAVNLLLLSGASGLSPFGLVILIPALNEIAAKFSVGFGQTQFLVSAYLIGLGIAQPIVGILSDRLGRRHILLVGFAVFIAASLACAVVDSLNQLIALRFLQALGASVGSVTTRAIVRDTHDMEGSARALSFIAAAMGVSPVLAPVIGGLVSDAYGPQSVFLVTAALGAVIWLWMLLRLPETHDPGSGRQITLLEWRVSYAQLIGSQVFMGYALIYGFEQGLFLAFMAVGASVFENYLQLGQQAFGLAWGLLGVAFIIGAVLGSRLTVIHGMRRVLALGVGITLIAGWALFAMVYATELRLWSLLTALSILMVANGMVAPLSLAGAISYRPLIAGTSSGLASSVGLVLSGACTIIAGAVFATSFIPVALLMAICATLTAAMWLMVRSREAHPVA